MYIQNQYLKGQTKTIVIFKNKLLQCSRNLVLYKIFFQWVYISSNYYKMGCKHFL